MRILFDQGVPVPLRKYLSQLEVTTVYELGWSAFTNGDLIQKAEDSEFTVFVTTDKNLKYQQNLKGRTLCIVILPTTSWPILREHSEVILSSIQSFSVGGYIEVILD